MALPFGVLAFPEVLSKKAHAFLGRLPARAGEPLARAAAGEGDHPRCTERSEGSVGNPLPPGARRRTLANVRGQSPLIGQARRDWLGSRRWGRGNPLATTHTSSPTCVCGSGRRCGLGTTCFARTPVPSRRGSDGSPAISMAMVRPFSHLSTRRSLRPSWTCRSVQIAPWRDGDERTSGGRAAGMTLPGRRRGHVRRRDEKTKVLQGAGQATLRAMGALGTHEML